MNKSNMIDNSYYRLRIHRVKCPICMFTSHVKKVVNKKILKGEALKKIKDYIFYQHPVYDEDDRKLFDIIIRLHAEYLMIMLHDIKSKRMYKDIRLKLNLDDVDLFYMTSDEKLKLICKVEDELNIERDNIQDEESSISKALTYETLPLLIDRFNKEIIQGSCEKIKQLSTSMSTTLNSITELTKNVKTTSENIKNIDEMELLDIDNTRKEKVVSLSDRIQKAVGNSE